MIDCNEAVGQLWQYIEHDLGDSDRADIEEHLALCRRCCGEVEFAEELKRFMSRRPDVELPSPVLSRLEHVIDELETHEAR